MASQLETMLTAAGPAPVRRRVLPFIGASVVAVLALAATAFWLLRDTPDPPLRVGRVTTITTAPGLELDPALSSDGRMLAYVAGHPGRTRIYIRQVTGGRDNLDQIVLSPERYLTSSPGGLKNDSTIVPR